MLEREVKLAFPSVDEARAAVMAAGASPSHHRRLQRDTLFDDAARSLRAQGCALRVRRDGEQAYLTFKGPSQPGTMKLREEVETAVEDASAMTRLLGSLGFQPWFVYEKFREEFSLPGVIVAVDDTPVGVFVELEGDEAGILRATAALGLSAGDFILQSYRGLFMERREQLRLGDDMLFAR